MRINIAKRMRPASLWAQSAIPGIVREHGSVRPAAIGDRLRRAGEGPARSILQSKAVVMERRLVGDRERQEIAPLGVGQLLQRVQMRVHPLRRQRRGGNGTDRVPAVAMPGGTPQGGAGMPADPDRWMRLLYWKGFAADLGFVGLEALTRRGTESLQTPCWSGMDSNFRFRARMATVPLCLSP